MNFDKIPEFMIDRAIDSLTNFRNEIDLEISYLRRTKMTRDDNKKHERNNKKILRDLVEQGFTDENQAIMWLSAQGHSAEYSREILKAKTNLIKHHRKAAVELEIFRRWIVNKECKTALAREFGVSRATVERLCKRLAENDGMMDIYRKARNLPPKMTLGN